ncbi:phosphotransferase [Candidatus Leptofilum sp.]|uniref:phosphotransferase n=1 Tax=Candidatus Leptofilum sp. TaxID=3241576 RepID=UPI003B5BA36E
MAPTSNNLAPELQHRLEAVAQKRISHVQLVYGGYTPAQRLKLTFADSTTCFAKIGTTPGTVSALRQEYTVYESLSGPFMPRFLGWDDHPDSPILLLEDLSYAFWPPPWNSHRIEQVLDSLSLMWAASIPNMPHLPELTFIWNGWQQVAENPAPFLSLGLATEDWLEQVLPGFLAIDYKVVANGRSLLHLDLRSDNICFSQERAILVDWNLVCVGNSSVDLGFWLPSLEAEGGPPPETLLPNAGEIAGLVSGFFAARAGLPNIPDAPRVRYIQLVQLKTALSWAVRTLGLPPLDGLSDTA